MKKSSSNTGQRSSGRQVKLSKAFKVIDDETRREIAEQRLNALEQDNYNEKEIAGYQDDDFSDDDSTAPKKKKMKKNQDIRSKWATRAVKSLERILLDNGISRDDPNVMATPNYYSVAAGPSTIPPRRKFCTICGYLGDYSCVRCGSRYCSIKCYESHQETKCLKQSM
eukprot:gene1969-2105_t